MKKVANVRPDPLCPKIEKITELGKEEKNPGPGNYGKEKAGRFRKRKRRDPLGGGVDEAMGNSSWRAASIAKFYTPRLLYTLEHSDWIKCYAEKYQLRKFW